MCTQVFQTNNCIFPLLNNMHAPFNMADFCQVNIFYSVLEYEPSALYRISEGSKNSIRGGLGSGICICVDRYHLSKVKKKNKHTHKNLDL